MRFTWMILPVMFAAMVHTSCGNSKKSHNGEDPVGSVTRNSIPDCLRKQIDSFSRKGAENPPVNIDEYTYNGSRVFLFTMGCCDQFNVLFDENCRRICAPSGGLTGRGDGKCPDFHDKAELVRHIWTLHPPE